MPDIVARLFAEPATELSRVIGYRAHWIGQIAKRYNDQGPDSMHIRRHTTSYRPAPVLSVEKHGELRAELAQAAARNQHWRTSDVVGFVYPASGRTVFHPETSMTCSAKIKFVTSRWLVRLGRERGQGDESERR